ncbi:glycerol-3-phosphate responsive antiterminator [Edaphobacter sp. HDX4]|uniref:glycerol-3-phosphate responsive antiterminator n=1 Tax=Edaphobacter sp. HDX4 TaxID=2794064 RepID=UPI002FE6BCC1
MATGSRIGAYHGTDETAKPEVYPVSISDFLIHSPIIAAVNTVEMFEPALEAPTKSLYLLAGSPISLPEMIRRAKDKGKVCLINIDFLSGLNRDRDAVEYLALHKAEGIVSTRFDVLKTAQALGLFTIQRTFAIDSAAITASIKVLSQFTPDAVEVLPAMAAPKVAKRIRTVHPGMKIIGGGLIETVREMEDLFNAGIDSVTVSNHQLWLI